MFCLISAMFTQSTINCELSGVHLDPCPSQTQAEHIICDTNCKYSILSD